MLKLCELGEMSFIIWKLGELGELYNHELGELGTASFRILKLGELG